MTRPWIDEHSTHWANCYKKQLKLIFEVADRFWTGPIKAMNHLITLDYIVLLLISCLNF